jgi:hypothetical protein
MDGFKNRFHRGTPGAGDDRKLFAASLDFRQKPLIIKNAEKVCYKCVTSDMSAVHLGVQSMPAPHPHVRER